MKLTGPLFAALLATPTLPLAAEFVLQLPLGAKATYSQVETLLPERIPVSPFENGEIEFAETPTHIRRTVWAFGGEQTLAQIQEGIVGQLQGSGYDVLMFCQTETCGGFDFRFAIDVVDEPDMWVDLRNFRFISARQTVLESPVFVSFLLSKSPANVFVQMTVYSPTETTVPQIDTVAVNTEKPLAPSEVSIVLEGLVFKTGSTKLGDDPNGSIAALAEKLKADKSLKVLLVGHSDMSGSLEGNISISKRRAESVRTALINEHGISGKRLTAHGVGFLSPRADNSTDAGKQKNRRVEAVFSR